MTTLTFFDVSARADSPAGATGVESIGRPGCFASVVSLASKEACAGGGFVFATTWRASAWFEGLLRAGWAAPITLVRDGATSAIAVTGTLATSAADTLTDAAATGRDCTNTVDGTAVMPRGASRLR